MPEPSEFDDEIEKHEDSIDELEEGKSDAENAEDVLEEESD